MLVNHWLGRLRFRTSPRRSGTRRRRFRVGPLAHVETLESRTLLSAAPVIAGFGLLEDTGTPGDYVTLNPTVTGTVTNDGSVANVPVEIDLNGDGMPEDTTYTDNDGVFVYYPAQVMPYGQKTFYARAWEYSEYYFPIYGAWVSLTFTYHNEAANVVALGVLNNVGTPEYPRTLDGLVTGTVANPDGGESGMNVEFDYDGDGDADDYTSTDTQGSFTYNVGMMLGDGLHTIHARVNESDSHGLVYGEWVELSFRYIEPPQIAFTAVHIGGYDWQLSGSVDYYAPWVLTIQFGGLADGYSAFPEPDGSFSAIIQIYESGIVTAQTTDEYGRDSNLAEDYVHNP